MLRANPIPRNLFRAGIFLVQSKRPLHSRPNLCSYRQSKYVGVRRLHAGFSESRLGHSSTASNMSAILRAEPNSSSDSTFEKAESPWAFRVSFRCSVIPSESLHRFSNSRKNDPVPRYTDVLQMQQSLPETTSKPLPCLARRFRMLKFPFDSTQTECVCITASPDRAPCMPVSIALRLKVKRRSKFLRCRAAILPRNKPFRSFAISLFAIRRTA